MNLKILGSTVVLIIIGTLGLYWINTRPIAGDSDMGIELEDEVEEATTTIDRFEERPPATKPPNPTSTSSPGNTGSSNTTSPKNSYALAEVKTHNTATSCWAAINNSVYDLTSWISRHPGGSDKILMICGTDASAAFNGKHSEDARPQSELAGFRIGSLVTQ